MEHSCRVVVFFFLTPAARRQEPACQDDVHAAEAVSWMVLETGVFFTDEVRTIITARGATGVARITQCHGTCSSARGSSNRGVSYRPGAQELTITKSGTMWRGDPF